MPPRRQFSKEDIVTKAFEIAAEEGLEGITARKVAERLGSSVAPIYSNFEHIDALKRAVVRKVADISRTFLQQRITGKPFLDLGIASLRFARQYSIFFRDLVLQENPYIAEFEQETSGDIETVMTGDSDLGELSEEAIMEVLLKMRIFQLGLSVMVANRLLPDEVDELMQIELLAGVGEDIIAAARARERADGADRMDESE